MPLEYKEGSSMPNSNFTIDDVRLLLQWAGDVEAGEMVESCNYTGSYFGFSIISVDELNLLCNTVNPILSKLGYGFRISWVAGEIRPVYDNQKIKVIDEDSCPNICRTWQRIGKCAEKDKSLQKKIPHEYRTFLGEFIRNTSPVSKKIMMEALASRFNLSPEYCREIVHSLYK